MCVLNSSLSDKILYLVPFTFKLAKHKMAAEIQRSPHIFYVFSHMKAQLIVSATFVLYIFFSSVFEKNNLYLTFKY